MDDLASLRVDYESAGIDPADMSEDPLVEFTGWFEGAVAAGVEEPNAFVLATATPEGVPSARAVLLKGFGPGGFVFYTNTESRKGQELARNPRAAACFVWIPLHRQVRIEGPVVAVAEEEADLYFASRPLESRLAAAASPQSQVVSSRHELEARYAEMVQRYPDGDVPRPAAWGGYRLIGERFEFWQGRPHRFHDRVSYRRDGQRWVIERLAP